MKSEHENKEGGQPGARDDWYSYGYSYASEPQVTETLLQPLLQQLRLYDELRLRLARQGGPISQVARMTALLKEEFTLESRFGKQKVSLADQMQLRSTLGDLGRSDLKFEVRMLDYGMPVYYLCRVQSDCWADYSLIVQDYYMSPGYPLLDERFAKLMSWGHEAYTIRLSPFRDGTAGLLGQSGVDVVSRLDDLMYRLGRHVFQAAWHEDQRVGMLTAQALALTHFQHAVELLYLCLSGELCELRASISDLLLEFFATVYPQPAIWDFLSGLGGLEGIHINALPQRALELFAKLTRAFGELLRLEVVWGHGNQCVPIYKLILGNLSRIEQIGRALSSDPVVREAAARLERVAESIICDLLRVPARAVAS
ncbi:MAG: hypothetical protein ACE5IY_12295 [bacterium]